MARELVLLPKVKYEKLLSSEDKQTSMDKETISHPNDEVLIDKPEDVEKAKRENTQTRDVTNAVDAIHDDKSPPTRKSMRKKKSQRGGKLYIETTPIDFLKKQTKRKWLSFKL